jgi:hypothetical protein
MVLLKNIDGLPDSCDLQAGLEYEFEAIPDMQNLFFVNGIFVHISNLENPVHRFLRLAKNNARAIILNDGEIKEVLQTQHYLIVHVYLNGGNFYYYHDVNNGNYIPDARLEFMNEAVIWKQRYK